jgi:hypothetical protein
VAVGGEEKFGVGFGRVGEVREEDAGVEVAVTLEEFGERVVP